VIDNRLRALRWGDRQQVTSPSHTHSVRQSENLGVDSAVDARREGAAQRDRARRAFVHRLYCQRRQLLHLLELDSSEQFSI